MSCRVCFEESTQKLQIFNNKERQKNIAEILEKHLWFAPYPNDPFSKFICIECWTVISDFNDFYEKIKQVHDEKLKQLEKTTIEIEDSTEFFTTDVVKIENDYEEDLYVTVSTEEIDIFKDENERNEFQNHQSATLLESEKNVLQTNDDDDISDQTASIIFRHTKQETAANDFLNLNKRKIKNSEGTIEPKRKRSKYTRSTVEDDQLIQKHINLNCEICNYKAEFFRDIVKHFASDHENIIAYINCCGRRFTKRERVLQHAWLHENPEHFQCPICKRAFRDNEIKTAHMKAQHPREEELIHHCDQCEKSFARGYLLKLHKAVHVPVEERQFLCNKCPIPKAFASQNLLNIHNSMSHNRMSNMCDVCGKIIRDRQAFKKHVRLHFEDSGPRVKCPQPGCESWLKDEDNLKQHLRRHNNNGQVFECDKCSKQCKDRRALNSHKRTVHPSVLFSCEACGKTLKSAISLKEHIATHTGEALYECPFCTQKFKSNANMHAHKKKMHPDEWKICKNLKNKQ